MLTDGLEIINSSWNNNIIIKLNVDLVIMVAFQKFVKQTARIHAIFVLMHWLAAFYNGTNYVCSLLIFYQNSCTYIRMYERDSEQNFITHINPA